MRYFVARGHKYFIIYLILPFYLIDAREDKFFPKNVIDIDNNKVVISELSKNKTVCIVTIKSVSCPVCTEQLIRIRDRMKEFNSWNQSVIDYVPSDRLLVYQVKDGWGPLCQFLNTSVPDIPFPYKNKTKNMGHMSRFINSMFVIFILLIIAVIISSVFFGVQYFG